MQKKSISDHRPNEYMHQTGFGWGKHCGGKNRIPDARYVFAVGAL